MNAAGKIGMLFCVLSLSASVQVRISDTEGRLLETVGAGQPFRVFVEMQGEGEPSLRGIDGLEQFDLLGRIEETRIAPRGRVDYKGYIVRSDEIGSYVVGPARVIVNGKEETSQTLTIEVKQEAKVLNGVDKKALQKPFAQLTVSLQEAYIREPLRCSLRFYFSRNAVQNVTAHRSEQEALTILDYEPARQGTETINGKVWNYVEWSWRMYATKSGDITVPACGIDYSEVRNEGFFFTTMQQKELYSNAVVLSIKPLPETDEPVQAVGLFDRCVMSVEPAVAKAGDGLVLTLRIEGEGVFDDAYPVMLNAMPPALKWYESKQRNLSVAHDGVQGKECEFVVQGLEPGEWTIPAQRFIFCNPKTGEIRSLESEPVVVTITENSRMLPTTQSPLQPPVMPLSPQSQELAPGVKGDGYAWWAWDYALPFWLFFVLSMLPALGVLLALVKRYVTETPLVRKKTIFAKAFDEFKMIKRTGQVPALYAMFTHLFVSLYEDPSLNITSSSLLDRLTNAGFKKDTLERWREFAERCAECAFSPQQEASHESLLLIAEQWLLFFKERL